jgi:hypothetical protein
MPAIHASPTGDAPSGAEASLAFGARAELAISLAIGP